MCFRLFRRVRFCPCPRLVIASPTLLFSFTLISLHFRAQTDPAMADVPIMFGGTKPHVYSLNDRKPTQFDK